MSGAIIWVSYFDKKAHTPQLGRGLYVFEKKGKKERKGEEKKEKKRVGGGKRKKKHIID